MEMIVIYGSSIGHVHRTVRTRASVNDALLVLEV